MYRKLTRQEFLKAGGGVFVGASVLGLAGCGAGGGSSSGSLSYWASQQAPTIAQDKQILGKVAKEFKKQTGVAVNVKVIGWEDLWNRITTAISSGQGPDVLNIGNTWSPSLQATGAFMPFDQDPLNAIGGKSKFIQTAYDTSGAPGKTPTSVPVYGLSYALFYNKAMFQEARIKSPPKTWEEFLAVAKKLTNPPNRWGLAVEGASVTENSHWAFILGRQQGGTLFDKKNKPTFDSPQIVRAVKQYVDFIAKDKIASPEGAQYSTGTQAPTDFANEKAAMIMFQTGTMTALASSGMKESEYGIAPIPVPDPLPPGGEPIMSHTAGINLSIFNNTQNQDGALKFVKFMTSKGQQTRLNQEYTSLPVTQTAAGEAAFHTDKLKVFQDIYANNSAPMPLIPDEGQMETLIGGAVKNLFAKAASTGKISEKDVRSELAEANQKMAASGMG
jgi:multiple sugar transport system substrate-binding protein